MHISEMPDCRMVVDDQQTNLGDGVHNFAIYNIFNVKSVLIVERMKIVMLKWAVQIWD